MNKVILEGVGQVNNALSLTEAKIKEILAKTVEEICKTGAEEGKRIITEMGAVDTGALRHSISGDVVKSDGSQVEGQVSAGVSQVRRGEGDFVYGKSGRARDVQATSEYAEKVEFGGGYKQRPRPFMGSTYNYLKSYIPSKLTIAVKSAITRIGR